MSKKLKNVTGSEKKEVDLGGRPPVVLTEEQIAKVETLASVLRIEQIADYFGIVHSTFYDIMKRDPRVFKSYKKGKAQAVEGVASNLVAKCHAGDVPSMIFYLKTQGRWKENHDQPEVNVNINTLTENQRRQKEIDIKLYDKYRRDMGFGMDSETAIDAEFVVEETKLLKDDKT
jgi:hypothetical protein